MMQELRPAIQGVCESLTIPTPARRSIEARSDHPAESRCRDLLALTGRAGVSAGTAQMHEPLEPGTERLLTNSRGGIGANPVV
jgi:hypothetical protein